MIWILLTPCCKLPNSLTLPAPNWQRTLSCKCNLLKSQLPSFGEGSLSGWQSTEYILTRAFWLMRCYVKTQRRGLTTKQLLAPTSLREHLNQRNSGSSCHSNVSVFTLQQNTDWTPACAFVPFWRLNSFSFWPTGRTACTRLFHGKFSCQCINQ